MKMKTKYLTGITNNGPRTTIQHGIENGNINIMSVQASIHNDSLDAYLCPGGGGQNNHYMIFQDEENIHLE